MLNQVLRNMSTVCCGCCQNQQHLWICNFSQGSVATYCRCGVKLCGVYIQNFPTNQLVKEFWKLVHICQSYYQTSRGILFLWRSVCNFYASARLKHVNSILKMSKASLMQIGTSDPWGQGHETVNFGGHE